MLDKFTVFLWARCASERRRAGEFCLLMSSAFTSSHDPLRRRLLMALALSPLLGSLPGRAAEAPPDIARVAALGMAADRAAVGIRRDAAGGGRIQLQPCGVAEPKLPATVVDVGQRTEPNLELLQQLQPSLVLLSQAMARRREKSNPSRQPQSFGFNDGSGKPLTVAAQSLLALGQRLGIESRAVNHLAQFDRFMQDARRLQSFTRQPLLLFSLIDTRHALIIGQKSLFQEAMDQLGIRNAWQDPTDFWGTAVVGIERLATVRNRPSHLSRSRQSGDDGQGQRDAAVAVIALRAAKPAAAGAGGVVLWRHAVDDAVLPPVGTGSGECGMNAGIRKLPLTLILLCCWRQVA